MPTDRISFLERFYNFVLNFIDMEAIVIEVKNDADIKFWLNLAKKTGTKAKSIDTEDIEDARLAKLIEQGMKTKSVSRESVMEMLGKSNEDRV
jgi:hypothetical protein